MYLFQNNWYSWLCRKTHSYSLQSAHKWVSRKLPFHQKLYIVQRQCDTSQYCLKHLFLNIFNADYLFLFLTLMIGCYFWFFEETSSIFLLYILRTTRLLLFFFLPVGSGPIPEVLQYRADPRQRWSKPLALRHDPKISLISLIPHGDRIRY